MFDVIFPINHQPEELSASNLRAKMNQIITQASIEDIEIKPVKQESPENKKKLKHLKKKIKISIDDPEKIVSTKVPSVVRVAPIAIPKETQNQSIVSL